ncbi:MAG: glycosyltransferase family 2 protein [Elusimicrobia bacterium]|nr:glycosyltransferase family 2 protein [Elusimicrobiota bacterium]MDE2509605.1 glycosyltransferase family 2 protein [Elusimicrobiota bacterium]
MPSPRLSVVVPAFNAGAFLRPAVLSVLESGIEGLEVVVADDGSTDGSVESLDGLDARVVRQANAGEASARNAGVRASRGGFVTFLDGDDLLIPSGLAARLEYLENHPKILDVGGLPSALIDERGAVIAPVFDRMAEKLVFPLSLTLERYRADDFFPVSASLYLYRREAFERAGPYDESLAAAPDADFHFRVLALGAIPVLKVPTFDRRLHGANLSLAAANSGAPSFRPEILSAIREVNRRHGLAPASIAPWEAEFL